MRILVTGGTGFLGKATALRLKSLGHTVTALGRNSDIGLELAQLGLRFARVDLAEREKLNEACLGHDYIVHCAALASPWGKYDAFHRANVVGTRNLLDAAIINGARRIVNISSPSIYFDYRSRLLIKESDVLPEKQVTHYGATKLLADGELKRANASGIDVIHLRPRAIFGPGDRTVLGRLIRMAESGNVPLVDGGNTFVDMTYIDNAVDAIVLALDAGPQCIGKTYNITNGEPVMTKEMFALLFGKLGLSPHYRNLSFSVANALAVFLEFVYTALHLKSEPPLTKYAVGLMARSQTLDISAARQELGYSPKVSLEEGFSRFATWWRSSHS